MQRGSRRRWLLYWCHCFKIHRGDWNPVIVNWSTLKLASSSPESLATVFRLSLRYRPCCFTQMCIGGHRHRS
jgi:hypothetical protein